MSDAPAPDALEIRADPDPVKRFSRKALTILLGGASAIVLGAFSLALSPANEDQPGAARELYSTTNKSTAEGLANMPASYADMNPEPEKPKLGPALQGDLGTTILAARERAGLDGPDRLEGAPTAADKRASEAELEAALRAAQLEETARTSKVFFQINKAGSVQNAPPPQQTSAQKGGYDPFAALAEMQALGPGAAGGNVGADPNHQARKIDFTSGGIEDSIYNPFRVQEPVSDAQIMAGSVIPASLITGINSDLPGHVIAQVTENVYDTVTGETLLIPQGARVIGRYDSVISFGQSRALLVWTRIILPDGSSIQVDNLPGVDGRGQAGLRDSVDHHTWQLAKGIALSTLLGVGAELATDDEDKIARAITDGVQDGANRAGQRIVERQLGVQPTLTIRPGWRFSIIAHQDIILRPYRGG